MEIEEILDQLPATANACPHLTRVGRHCSVEFLIEVESRAFQLTVQSGRITDVHLGPLNMRAWRFAIRAGESAWREFWSPMPRPGFNDIFAMASRGHARIEGDVGPLLEHLRFFKELVQLPRSMQAQSR
ncbi:MAG: hypothetical protein OXC08_12180 [Thiotrichales bacterium]|nr:hypothetical protein [Thiotrichales bacterium]